MMGVEKGNVKKIAKEFGTYLISDRYFLILTVFMILLATGFAISICFSINANGIQRVSHYTTFGNVNRYTDQWYYPLFFALFEVVVAIFHSIIALKIFKQKGRSLAIMFIWFGISIITLGWMAAQAVLYGTL